MKKALFFLHYNYVTRYLVLSILFIHLAYHNAFAQDVDPASLIIPQQQKLLEQEKTNREIEDFKEWESRAEEENEKAPATEDKSSENCFQINNIVLDGNTILSKSNISKAIKQYQNTCVSVQTIADLVGKVNALYKDKGYITTQVYVKEQNLKLGNLTLSVIEGKVEDVRFGNNTTADKVTGYFITPLSKGDTLNFKEVDQTAENLSYIPSYQYKTNIEAGSKAGLSKINIGGVRSFPISPYIETDTLGQQYTGYNRYTLGSRIDNPLKLALPKNIF